MRVFICGANGFIGGAIAARLATAGHTIIKGVHTPSGLDEVAIDYSRDLSPEMWLPRLKGVDVVINAVGILVETDRKTFLAIHDQAPRALFAACVQSGVKRIIQISALGAERGNTPYFQSKLAADNFLTAQAIEWYIVRPALVYGKNGSSAKFFRTISSLPVIGLPAGGRQMLQPIHIDDLTEAVLCLLDPSAAAHQIVEAVGGRPLEYREILRCYRQAMGILPAIEIPIPQLIMKWLAGTAGLIPGAILNADTWKMLQEGNTGDTSAVTKILGRAPHRIDEFISTGEAAELRQQAFAAWRNMLLRLSLAFVWIVTGLVSLFLFSRDDSLAMLSRVGIEGTFAQVALYSAAVIDFTFGIATLIRPCRVLWTAQLALILVYTLIIAIALPEYLIHPFGPITKNVPIVAMLFLLYAEEKS